MDKEILLKTLSGIASQILLEAQEKAAPGEFDPALGPMFRKCFMNTAETTFRLDDKGAFLITGDIEAMWLRDSSSQVVHYLPFAKDYPVVGELIRSLVLRQFHFINLDPYANAFNDVPKRSKWRDLDRTDMNDWEWERKYEVDSLCFPVKLLTDYYGVTGDSTVFTEEVHRGMWEIVRTFRREQRHQEESSYSFERIRDGKLVLKDSLTGEGKGAPVAFTGMTWSGFRPSDDPCTYGYLIPSNLFAAKILADISEFSDSVYHDEALQAEAMELSGKISRGIEKFGVKLDTEFGEIYSYEVDGCGNTLFMDDANVPSLLSLPWLHICEKDNPRYLRTRRAVFSAKNPFYYCGTAASGIGSPHTKAGNIWPIALCMQGLTTDDRGEKLTLLRTLMTTDAGTGYMHESFNKDAPEDYTRPWFAWANSLFSLLFMDIFYL